MMHTHRHKICSYNREAYKFSGGSQNTKFVVMASSIQEKDLNLRTIYRELQEISFKWFAIGLQLGISRSKLLEFKDDPSPLSAVIDYWLKGNVTEQKIPIAWRSIVMAVRFEQETQLAETISTRYCQLEAVGESGHQGPLLPTSDEKRVFLSHEHQQSQPEQRPPTNELRPSVAEQRPSMAEPKLSVAEQRPSMAEPRPSVAEQRPSVAEPRLSVLEQRQSMAEPRPSVAEQRPSMAEPRPSVAEQRPSMAEPRPSVAEQRPSTAAGQRPSTTEWKPSTIELRPPTTELIAGERPSTNELRLSTNELRLSTAEQRPSTTEWTSSTVPLTTEFTSPSTIEWEPSTAELRPSTTELRPSTKELRLSTAEQRPSTTEQRHSINELRLSTTEQRPSTTELRHSTNELRLSTAEQRPSATEWRSSTYELRPSTTEQRQSTNELRLSNAEQRPSTTEQRHSTNELRLSTAELRPSTTELRHSINELRLSTTEQRPSATEWRPSANELRPSTTKLRHSTNELRLSTAEQRPSDTEWRSSTYELRPSTTEQRKSTNELRLSTAEQRPSATEWRSSTYELRPSTTEQRQSTNELRLSTAEQRPSATEWRPSAVELRPSTSESRLSTAESRLSTAEQRPSATEWRPSAVELRPSTTELRPSKCESRLSTAEQRPSATEWRPSAVELRPSTTELRPSTSESRLSTAELRPSTTELRHSINELRLSTTEQRPSATEWRPSAVELRPSTTKLRPSTTELRHSTNELRLSTAEQRPSATEWRSSTVELRPSTNESRLSTAELRPSTTELRHSINELRLSTAEQRPSATEWRPSTVELRPSTTELRHSTNELRLSTAEQRPSATEWRSSTTEQRHSTTEQRHSTNELRLSTAEQRPSATEWRPSTIEQRHSTNELRLSTAKQRPSATEWRSSTVELRPSTNESRLSTAEQRSSATEWRSSTIELRPSTTEQRPSTNKLRLSTAEQSPFNTEWRPSTVELRPTIKQTPSRPSPNEIRHSTTEQRPSTTEWRPSTVERRPLRSSTTELRPSITGQQASTISLTEDRKLTTEKAIASKYTSYVKRLQTIIEAKGVPPESLRYFILSLSDPMSETYDLEKCTTISEIFNFLSTERATFLNNHIFEEIIKQYEINDEEVLQYTKHLEKYIKWLKISEYVKTDPMQQTTSSDFKKMILKIDTKSGRLNAEELKTFVEKMLKMSPSTLQIINFQDDTVTFLIPASAAYALFSPSARFSLQQEDEFRAASVLWLKCNSYTFHFKSDRTDSQQSQFNQSQFNQHSHPSNIYSKQVSITVDETHTQISTVTATAGSSSNYLATNHQPAFELPSEWEKFHSDTHTTNFLPHPTHPDECPSNENLHVTLRAAPNLESSWPDVVNGPLVETERNYDRTHERASQPLLAGAAASEGRSHPRTIRHCTNSYPGASGHRESENRNYKLSLQDTQDPRHHSDAAIHPITFAAGATGLSKTDYNSSHPREEYPSHHAQDTAALSYKAGYAQAVAELGYRDSSLLQKQPLHRTKTEPQLALGEPLQPIRSQTQVHCRQNLQHQNAPPAQNPSIPSTSTPRIYEVQLPAHFAGVNVSPYPDRRDDLGQRRHKFRHMSSTATESSEEGSFKTTYSEPSLTSNTSLDHANHSFHHSHSQGSDMSGSLDRSPHRRAFARGLNRQTSSIQDYNFSQEEISMRDTDSVKRLLESGSRQEQDEYIAVLILQQFAQSRHSPWKMVFTVCRRNPCCIKPLLALLYEENKEVFTASAFTVKFNTSPQNPGQITLKFPMDMKQQGYDVFSDYTPCTILKDEASQSLDHITGTNPPRCKIRITPLHKGNDWKPLRALLELEGTDDSRKFMLTNPEIVNTSPVPHVEPTIHEQQDGQSNTWPELEPNSSENNLIKRIINEVELDDHWKFGVELGVPMEDLSGIITGQSKGNHPSITMNEIFSCWDKKVINPSQRSWEQVVRALNAIGYITLLNDIIAELDNR